MLVAALLSLPQPLWPSWCFENIPGTLVPQDFTLVLLSFPRTWLLPLCPSVLSLPTLPSPYHPPAFTFLIALIITQYLLFFYLHLFVCRFFHKKISSLRQGGFVGPFYLCILSAGKFSWHIDILDKHLMNCDLVNIYHLHYIPSLCEGRTMSSFCLQLYLHVLASNKYSFILQKFNKNVLNKYVHSPITENITKKRIIFSWYLSRMTIEK